MDTVTYRQKKFARLYVKNAGNGAQAARDAGYSDKSGADAVQASRLLRNDKVSAAIKKEAKKAITAANLRPEDIVDGLLNEAGLKGKKPKDSQQGGRVRALELCGKTFALFADRTITDEAESIGGRELVLRLAPDTPTAAIGMAIDLCLLDIQMAEALEPVSPVLAARVRKLLEARKPLDVVFDHENGSS